jgi:hypothetical protein
LYQAFPLANHNPAVGRLKGRVGLVKLMLTLRLSEKKEKYLQLGLTAAGRLLKTAVVVFIYIYKHFTNI